MLDYSFIVETSARHIHLSSKDLTTLFGENASLNFVKELSQNGQFVSDKRLTIIGAKGEISNVAVLGPIRSDTQVELSITDSRKIGVNLPVRESGDISNSGKCTLVGPVGKVLLESGAIIARRHIHLNPDMATMLNISNKDVVWVKILSGASRPIIFGDVIVRVSEDFSPAMHVDTDEANAAGFNGKVIGTIIKV